MTDRTLYYDAGTAAMAPHTVLEELGLPLQLVRIDRAAGAHREPAFLRLNPNGQVPVYVEGPLVLFEAAAICLHLADTHPDAGLLPPHGTADRAHALKWLVWMTNSLQAALLVYFYPERWAGDAAAESGVRDRAAERVGTLLDILDGELARHGGPWVLGTAHSVLDSYGFMLGRWTRGFAGAVRPARERPHLGPWLQRVLARPATARMLAAQGLPAPYV